MIASIVASLYAADTPHLEISSKEMLEALFKGIEHLPVSYLQRFRFIDIESLLEDSVELGHQFRDLSDQQKQELVDTVELLNQAIAEALLSIELEEEPIAS